MQGYQQQLAQLATFVDTVVAEISGPSDALQAASPLIASLKTDVAARHRELGTFCCPLRTMHAV